MTRWTTQLFEKPSSISCVFEALCCPSFLLAKVRANLSTNDPMDEQLNRVLGCFLMPYLVIAGAFTRNELRRKYNIEGTFAQDLLLHTFCMWCALHQEVREVERRGSYETRPILLPPTFDSPPLQQHTSHDAH